MSPAATPAIESATGAGAELFARKAAGKVSNIFPAISSPETRRNRMDRLAVMETFIRVVEAGSFSTAAKHLNVGQPAVSKAIARLEERLRTRLLLRSSRGLRPTEAGHNFYERARRAIEEADEAYLAARDAGAGFVGQLRVSACAAFASLHIIPRLPTFLAAHPDLSIDLILDDREIDIIEEGVDIALRIGELRASAVTARKVATSRRVVLGAPAYFERAGIPATPAELTGHAEVIHTQVGGETWSFRQGGSEVSVSASGRLRVSAVEGMRAAVLGGMGLAITSEWMFAPELASGAVRRVLAEWTLPMVNLWAVFPTGRMASARARAFAAFVEAELRESADNNVIRDFADQSWALRNAPGRAIEAPQINPAAHRHHFRKVG